MQGGRLGFHTHNLPPSVGEQGNTTQKEVSLKGLRKGPRPRKPKTPGIGRKGERSSES